MSSEESITGMSIDEARALVESLTAAIEAAEARGERSVRGDDINVALDASITRKLAQLRAGSAE
jgi:hypothetical protein